MLNKTIRANISVIVLALTILAVIAVVLAITRDFIGGRKAVKYEPAGNNYKETLHVISDSDYFPFSYLDEQGNLTGHDVELITIIANKLGLNLDIKAMSWREVLEYVKSGFEGAVLSCELSDRQSELMLEMSDPTSYNDFVAFGRKETKSINQLFGRRIGTVKDANAYSCLMGLHLSYIPYFYANNMQAFEALERNEIDYVAVRYVVGRNLIDKHGFRGVKGHVSIGKSLQCIGVAGNHKLLEDINRIVSDMKYDGSLRRLNEKWIAPFSAPQSLGELIAVHPFLFAVFIVLLILVLVQLAFMEMRRRNAIIKSEKREYNILMNVTDEISNPMTMISGPINYLLKENLVSDSAYDILKKVNIQTGRITGLLNTTLITMRLRKGSMEPEPVLLGLNKWLRDFLMDVKAESELQGIGISFNEDSAVGMASVDEELVKCVLSNLILNATKYSGRGNEIELSTVADNENDKVRICVRHTGSGIGDADFSKVIEQYSEDYEDRTGLGVNMYYSAIIVAALGGRVGAYNNHDGSGATFWFELPLNGA